MPRPLFIFGSAVSLIALAGCGGPPVESKPAAPPQTQEGSDVSVALKDLGPVAVTTLAPNELYRMNGGGLDVVCSNDYSTCLMASPEVRLPLTSPQAMQYRKSALAGLLGGDPVNPPASPQEEANDRVLRFVTETQMLSMPFWYIPDRLSQALCAAGPRREQYAALVRTILRDEPVRLTGQSRTAEGVNAWQIELRLTSHGRAKLQAALRAPPASRPPTMPSTQLRERAVTKDNQ